MLGLADEETREAVLDRLDADRREKVQFLLEFGPESAAGLMDLDYVTVDADQRFEAVGERVRRHEQRTGRFPRVFVTEDGELLGELPAAALSMTGVEGEAVVDYVEETPTVRYDRPDTDVVDVFRANPESAVAVLDDDGSILGVIHAEDLLRVIEEEASETLKEFTGVEGEESVLDGPVSKVRNR